MVVILDNDDVIVDFVGTLVRKYNEKYGTNYTPEEDVTEWNINNEKFEHGLFTMVKDDPNIIFDMPLRENKIKDVLEKYYNLGVRFYMVSNTMEEGTFDNKVELLRRFGIDKYFDKFVKTDCKFIVKADVIIDDYIGNLDDYKKYHPFAWTLLMDDCHNKNVDKEGIHTRVRNWDEIDFCLEEILKDMEGNIDG